MFYVDNIRMTAQRGEIRGGRSTLIASPESLTAAFTRSQLLRLAKNELGDTAIRKGSLASITKRIFRGIEDKLSLDKVATTQSLLMGNDKPDLLMINYPPRITRDRVYVLRAGNYGSSEVRMSPQLRKLYEVITDYAKEHGIWGEYTDEALRVVREKRVEVTKGQLLSLLAAGGFVSQGDPWNNVMLNRTQLIELGAMVR
jgi:hypothetical protein